MAELRSKFANKLFTRNCAVVFNNCPYMAPLNVTYDEMLKICEIRTYIICNICGFKGNTIVDDPLFDLRFCRFVAVINVL